MKRLVALLSVVMLLLIAAVAYSYLKPTAAPSGPITADPVSTPSGDTDARVFTISQEGSQARFIIDEVLNGSPKTVVGTTNQVAGQISIDPNDVSSTRVGTIRINVRTFQTDSSQRDRAIQNRILETSSYEFITFTPREITGLPGDPAIGRTYNLKITGDLKIKDVSREVTFDVTVKPESQSRLTGKATATIKYADWGISIPQVPFVANVSDEVRLELDFLAVSS
mgnify:FL=1